VFFEKRVPQNLPFVKTWKNMENAGARPQSPKTDPNRRKCGRQRTEKAAKMRRTSCGTAENMLYYFA
jgi:hypothetical protein